MKKVSKPRERSNAKDRVEAYEELLASEFSTRLLTTIPSKPGKGTFHNPSFGEDMKAVAMKSGSNLYVTLESIPKPIGELATISGIGPKDSKWGHS